MQTFDLYRTEDVNGNSGEGIVATGVILPSGKTVLEWQTKVTSVGVYESIDDVRKLHGHEGRTIVRVYGKGSDDLPWHTMLAAVKDVRMSLAFYKRPWMADPGLAYVFSVLAGCDDDSMMQLAHYHGWSQDVVERLYMYQESINEIVDAMEGAGAS